MKHLLSVAAILVLALAIDVLASELVQLEIEHKIGNEVELELNQTRSELERNVYLVEPGSDQFEENVFISTILNNDTRIDYGSRATVTWSAGCPVSAGGAGNGNFNGLTFAGCATNRSCDVVMDTNYRFDLEYSPRYTELGLSMTVTAVPLSPSTNPSVLLLSGQLAGNPPYIPGTRYSVFADANFLSSKLKGKSGDYTLQLRLYSTNTKANVVCRAFTVHLNASTWNEGVTHGASCTVLNEPCSFASSLCVKNGTRSTCQCNYASAYEGATRGCREIIGTHCEVSEECIEHAYCPLKPGLSFGYCNCTRGYENDLKDTSKLDICYRTQSGNTGNRTGASCDYLNEPCALPNSICGVNSSAPGNGTGGSQGQEFTCQCTDISSDEGAGRGCKRIVGAPCEGVTDCVNHAECQKSPGSSSGFCNCIPGYTSDASTPHICYEKKDTGSNNGTAVGSSCSELYKPCALANSICASSGSGSGGSKTCQCIDGSTFNEGSSRGCKKIVGTYCIDSADCITNAYCPINSNLGFGFCDCLTSFNATADYTRCSGSSSRTESVTFFLSVFLLTSLQFVSKVFQM